MPIKAKKIKGKEVVFIIGRGEYCRCADCPVLYGGNCPYDLKFALHPGEIISPNDGQRHLIGTQKLIHLYHLEGQKWVSWNTGARGRRWDDYVHLYPRENGDYEEFLQRAIWAYKTRD